MKDKEPFFPCKYNKGVNRKARKTNGGKTDVWCFEDDEKCMNCGWNPDVIAKRNDAANIADNWKEKDIYSESGIKKAHVRFLNLNSCK